MRVRICNLLPKILHELRHAPDGDIGDDSLRQLDPRILETFIINKRNARKKEFNAKNKQ